MKLSEVSRYWAARELTRIERADNRITFHAPFACSAFTVQFSALPNAIPRRANTHLAEVSRLLDLKPGSWHRAGQNTTVCLDLPKGASDLVLS
jgi:hypothetical protein